MRVYRLRIRNAADSAWEYTFTNFVKPPTLIAQRVYPLDGKTTSKPGICELEADSTFIAALADADDRYALSSRIADISYADDGGSFTVLSTGRVASIKLAANRASATVELHDERLIERTTSIFTYSDTTRVWLPGVSMWGGYWGRINMGGGFRTLTVSYNARSAPVTSLILNGNNVASWPRSVQEAINDDVKPGLSHLSSGSVSEGSFNYLRLYVNDGVNNKDYEVVGFAYTNDAADSPSTVTVGTRPAQDDNMLAIFVYDPVPELSGVSLDQAWLHFPKATDDDGLYVGYAPTEDVPLHVEGQPFEILQAIYDGDYGGRSVKYDATQMTALQSDSRFPPNIGIRVTKGPQNMAAWVEEHIYKPFLTVPLINGSGEVVPTPLLLTDADEIGDVDNLTLLDASNVTAPPEWDYAPRDQITKVVFRAQHRALRPGFFGSGDVVNPNYAGALDRWEDREVVYTHKAREDEYGIHTHELDIWPVYEPEAVEPDPTTGRRPENAEGTEQFAEAWAPEWLDRFADAPVWYSVEVLPSVTEGVGEWVALDCAELQLPNAYAGDRSGKRVVQIVTRQETVTGAHLDLLDGGPYLQPLATPTISAALNANDPKHTIRLTIDNLATGAKAQVQAARSKTTPAEGSWYGLAVTDAATLDAGGLASNTKYYFRCRAVAEHRLSSDWSASDAVQTDAMSPPTSVNATATNGSEIITTWTLGESREKVQVLYDTVSTFTTTATDFETFQVGTTGCTVGGLTSSTQYWIYVRHVDAYGGFSETASDDATTTASPSTLTAPDQIYIELGYGIGTRTAP